jgi:hypothetical protein
MSQPWQQDFGFAEPPVRRKRHPIRATIVTLVIIAVLGGGLYYASDTLARQFAVGFVQEGVVSELGVGTNKAVHVDLGTAPILPQIIARRVDDVRVAIDKLSTDTLTGAAVLTAEGVPLDLHAPVDKVAITMTIPAADLRPLLTTADEDPKDTVKAGDKNDLVVSKTVSVLGKKYPVEVAIAPTAAKGALLLTPTGVTVKGKHYAPSQLRSSPIRALAGGLLKPRAVCIAGSLPSGLALTAVSVRDGALSLSVAGADLPLSSLASKGSCA